MPQQSADQSKVAQQQSAQFIYLAQLNAAKGTCKCETCQLLRKGNDMMTAMALSPAAAGPAGMGAMLKQALGTSDLPPEEIEV